MQGIKNLKLNYPLMCYDVVFKSVFLGNENILAKMISDITGFNYSILEDNITLECNELPIEIKGEKFKKCDFIVKVDKDMILNLELNTKSYGGILVKGLSYAFNFSSHLRPQSISSNSIIILSRPINCFSNFTSDPDFDISSTNSGAKSS